MVLDGVSCLHSRGQWVGIPTVEKITSVTRLKRVTEAESFAALSCLETVLPTTFQITFALLRAVSDPSHPHTGVICACVCPCHSGPRDETALGCPIPARCLRAAGIREQRATQTLRVQVLMPVLPL